MRDYLLDVFKPTFRVVATGLLTAEAMPWLQPPTPAGAEAAQRGSPRASVAVGAAVQSAATAAGGTPDGDDDDTGAPPGSPPGPPQLHRQTTQTVYSQVSKRVTKKTREIEKISLTVEVRAEHRRRGRKNCPSHHHHLPQRVARYTAYCASFGPASGRL